jgi:HSP20 family protein
LASLRRSIDRLIDDFDGGFFPTLRQRFFDIEPFRPGEFISAPAADLTETDKSYELSMELPGLDESNVDVTVANRLVTISGEKKEEKKEERKDYYLSERRYGSFKRSFRVPEGVDTDKIEANFVKGVLKLTLPKTPEAQQPVKKVKVKGA